MPSCRSSVQFQRSIVLVLSSYQQSEVNVIHMERKQGLAMLKAILHSGTARTRCSRTASTSIKFYRMQQVRRAHTPADDPAFTSVLDTPAQIISTRKKHTIWGVITLSLIPLTAFFLGSWQVQRLDWKTKLIAKFEDRLVRPPLPLPPRIDPSAVTEFDYRRVYATGHFRHDREMLIGPRMHDGVDGFLVVTPLERRKGESMILVNRGWISREKRFQQDRQAGALPEGEVTVSGLLREPWKRNFFTPENKPQDGKFYFPDVFEMAEASGSDPVWIEETMRRAFTRQHRSRILTGFRTQSARLLRQGSQRHTHRENTRGQSA